MKHIHKLVGLSAWRGLVSTRGSSHTFWGGKAVESSAGHQFHGAVGRTGRQFTESRGRSVEDGFAEEGPELKRKKTYWDLVISCEFAGHLNEISRCKLKCLSCDELWIQLNTRPVYCIILINSPCAYQSAAWKESKPLELPKCSNGTLELESGIYEAPENRGMLVRRLRKCMEEMCCKV